MPHRADKAVVDRVARLVRVADDRSGDANEDGITGPVHGLDLVQDRVGIHAAHTYMIRELAGFFSALRLQEVERFCGVLEDARECGRATR